MAEAVGRDRKLHTGSVLAMLFNVHRGPSQAAKYPWHYFPDLKPAALGKPLPGSITDLKVFLPGVLTPDP